MVLGFVPMVLDHVSPWPWAVCPCFPGLCVPVALCFSSQWPWVLCPHGPGYCVPMPLGRVSLWPWGDTLPSMSQCCQQSWLTLEPLSSDMDGLQVRAKVTCNILGSERGWEEVRAAVLAGPSAGTSVPRLGMA